MLPAADRRPPVAWRLRPFQGTGGMITTKLVLRLPLATAPQPNRWIRGRPNVDSIGRRALRRHLKPPMGHKDPVGAGKPSRRAQRPK